MSNSKRQYIWLVRYGLTERALVENVGPYDSDIDPNVGMTHARAIADRIAMNAAARPSVVYSDPFLRCTHTADVIVKALVDQPAKIHRIEEGITEWLVPSLLVDPAGNKTDPRSVNELQALFPENIDLNYRSVNPVVKDGTPRESAPQGAPLFIESQADLYARCATTVSRILETINEDNIVIVSHAPCLQMMALKLEGYTDPSESKLGYWSLGGLTRFSRRCDAGDGPWQLDFYSDTCHMPGDYQDGIKGRWSLPSFIRD